MEKCWYRQVYWIINFLYNLNTKSSYKSHERVWGASCLNMSWCGIDIGSELKCISYCSASWNDCKYQWYAGSVRLSLPTESLNSAESNSILLEESTVQFYIYAYIFQVSSRKPDLFTNRGVSKTIWHGFWLTRLCYGGLTPWPFGCRTGFFDPIYTVRSLLSVFIKKWSCRLNKNTWESKKGNQRSLLILLLTGPSRS